MKWRGRRKSSNIEDRRGRRVKRGAGIGGIGTIVLVLVAMYFGVDPQVALKIGQGFEGVGYEDVPYQETPASQERFDMVRAVLADTEDVWNQLFLSSGKTYREPIQVLFTDSVHSACGHAGSAMGPFYCPADYKMYMDLSFFDDLSTRHGAPGEFAQAYVIAHEVGHHVQNLLGISKQVREAQRGLSSTQSNQYSIRQELQADCFAGLWANHNQQATGFLESGDLEKALNAAAAIGDDRLQKQAQGYVVPDSFTHGSSAQRVRWFKRGFESGKVSDCDTFAVNEL
ncbi:MAG: KPN_02809 family neutral zinc metallopeptidase [bacterium]